MKLIFDYTDEDYCYDIGGEMMMDSEGNLMQYVGGNMALDIKSGEIHILDCSDSLLDGED